LDPGRVLGRRQVIRDWVKTALTITRAEDTERPLFVVESERVIEEYLAIGSVGLAIAQQCGRREHDTAGLAII
jgi:hypothetical protein